MALDVYLAFVAACVLLALLPGPTMMMLIATSTTKGLKNGLLVLAGNASGLVVLVAAAVLGMAPLLAATADWFDWVRIIGALYLTWMGIGYIRKAQRGIPEGEAVVAKSHHIYLQGLAVSLSNPKTLLFLGAFFPQFVDPARPLFMQLLILGASFVVFVTLVDFGVVMMSGYAGRWLVNRYRETHYVGGMLLIGAGAMLALAKK